MYVQVLSSINKLVMLRDQLFKHSWTVSTRDDLWDAPFHPRHVCPWPFIPLLWLCWSYFVTSNVPEKHYVMSRMCPEEITLVICIRLLIGFPGQAHKTKYPSLLNGCRGCTLSFLINDSRWDSQSLSLSFIWFHTSNYGLDIDFFLWNLISYLWWFGWHLMAC